MPKIVIDVVTEAELLDSALESVRAAFIACRTNDDPLYQLSVANLIDAVGAIRYKVTLRRTIRE